MSSLAVPKFCFVLISCQVLQGLINKGVLVTKTVVEIEEGLKEREILVADSALSPIAPNGQTENRPVPPSAGSKANGVARLDKRQIEQRIEEDRERHKRLRENIWAVSDKEDEEFEKMWEEASDIGEDDYLVAEEEAMERRQTLEAL